MNLTLDEEILRLLLDGVKNWQMVQQLVGNSREDLSRVIYCRYLQIKTRYDNGMRYVGDPPRGSGRDKILTNDEWFILLLLFGQQSHDANKILQRIVAEISFCQTVHERYMSIYTRYERGWRANADPSITASA